MDTDLIDLLRAMGTGRLQPVDSEVIRLYLEYKQDRSTVPPDIRDFFDAFSRRKSATKLKDDEAFRFFLDDSEA